MQIETLSVPQTRFGSFIKAYIQDDRYDQRHMSCLRPGMLILPGGGYSFTSDREAEPIALYYLNEGYNAFVLRYTVAAEAKWPDQLEEAMRTMALLRERASEWGMDPQRLAVIGFSAGGHLAANLAVDSSDPELLRRFALTREQVRPNAVVLSYPVISSGPYQHEGSFDCLLREDASDPAKRARVSLEKRVTADTPPCYIWHTADDGAVPVQNSLLFAQALADHQVPFSLRIFEHGPHGLARARWFDNNQLNDLEIAGWTEESARFLEKHLV